MFLTSKTTAVLLQPVRNLMTVAQKVLQTLHWGVSAAVDSNVAFACFKLLLSLIRCVSLAVLPAEFVLYCSSLRQGNPQAIRSQMTPTSTLASSNSPTNDPQTLLPPTTTQPKTPTGTLAAYNNLTKDPDKHTCRLQQPNK